jgi:hypothetical protein
VVAAVEEAAVWAEAVVVPDGAAAVEEEAVVAAEEAVAVGPGRPCQIKPWFTLVSAHR